MRLPANLRGDWRTRAFYRRKRKVTHLDRASPDDVRVLFVEDDAAVAQVYKLKLELDGYWVDIAGDGEMALQMARRSVPDLIFMDIRLPKLGGLEVLEALRGDPQTSKVPVVILSSNSERELVERGARLGALDHLIKSKTTPAQLAEGVEGWLPSSAPTRPRLDPRRGPPLPRAKTHQPQRI
jgi:CheY-like chemotaxis protein